MISAKAALIGIPLVLSALSASEPPLPETIDGFSYRTSYWVRGEPMKVRFTFNTANGKNKFNLLVRAVDYYDEDIVRYQIDTPMEFDKDAGIVEMNFTIPAAYTKVSNFRFDWQIRGYKDGIHVDAGYFWSGIQLYGPMSTPFHMEELVIGEELNLDRYRVTNGVKEYCYMTLKSALTFQSLLKSRRIVGIDCLTLEFRTPDGVAPNELDAELWLRDYPDNFEIGKIETIDGTKTRVIDLKGKVAGTRNGTTTIYGFKTTKKYVLDRRDLSMREFKGGSIGANEALVDEVFYPAALAHDGGKRNATVVIDGIDGSSDTFAYQIPNVSIPGKLGHCNAKGDVCVVLGSESK